MYRPVFRVLIVITTILVSACDRPEAVDLTCDQYFLEAESPGVDATTKVFYNSQDKISALDLSYDGYHNRVDFIYDLQGRLAEARHQDTNARTEFRYDATGKLVATLRFPTGLVKLDSFAIEYDASGRISKRSVYTESNGSATLDSFFTVDYPDELTVNMMWHDNANPSGPIVPTENWVFVVDGKPLPYPTEFYYHQLAWYYIMLPSNPVSFRTFRASDGMPNVNESYRYEYNDGGYPIKEIRPDYSITYSYSCTARSE